jgi:hypothetical protein
VTRIGCTGHRNISPATRGDIAAAITAFLAAEAHNEFVGLSSLAEGADQVFALAVLAAGGQLHVVIPSQNYERSFESKQARCTYTVLLSLAESSNTLAFDAPSEDAYLAAGHDIVDRCDVLLAVWDGQGAAGKGGTADIVTYARERKIDTHVIWPPGAQRD